MPQTPPFLKLHVEGSSPSDSAELGSFAGADELARSFELATGWKLRRDDKSSSPSAAAGSLAEKAGSTLQLEIEQARSDDEESMPKIDRSSADPLAASIAGLLNELEQTQLHLRQREAELAVCVPVAPHSDAQTHLSKRLEAVLKSGAQVVAADAAALYLLNDDTSQLKLRSSWNLKPQHYLESARPLRGAVADLEALLGHAVVIEDTSTLTNWNPPLDFASAVCVPVATPTTLLGTLWIFGDEPRDYSPLQTNMMEIVAGRVASDLEREALMQQSIEARNFDRLLGRAAEWQQRRLPNVTPLLDDWQVAGCTTPAETVGNNFYDWNVVSDGRLAVSLGEGHGQSLEAGLISAVLHAALRAHSAYPHNSSRLLEQVNETLWTSSSGNQIASLFYALIDSDQGKFEYASAGRVSGLLLKRRTCEILTRECPSLGLDSHPCIVHHEGRLEPGESLILLSEGVGGVFKARPGVAPLSAVAAYLKGHRGAAPEQLIELLRTFAETYERARPAQDRTILVVRRRM